MQTFLKNETKGAKESCQGVLSLKLDRKELSQNLNNLK